MSLIREQRERYAYLRHARSDVQKPFEQCKEKYYGDLQIARVILKKDKTSLTKLGAKGKRKFAMGSWLEQARLFYNNALQSNEILEQLNKMRLDEEALNQGLFILEQLQTILATREARNADATNATTEGTGCWCC